jgi:hypothetical protein
LLAALLVIVITSFIALVAVAASLLYLGFTPNSAQELAESRAQLGTAQAQNVILQTEIAAQALRGNTDHEILGEMQRQFADIGRLQTELRQEREASLSQNATLVAEARSSRDAVALFATAEAGRAALLQQLDQRSARVERFLQRLSDISGDAALDLGANPVDETTTAVPAPAISPAPTTISELSPTPVPSSTPAPSATPAPSPTGTPRTTLTPTPGR